MLKLFKGKSASILGIDLSSGSIKLLEMNGSITEHTVSFFFEQPLEAEFFDGNVIKNIDAVASVLKDLIGRNKITTKDAAIAVPDSTVISKVIQLNDGLSDSEMEELVILEADKYIPYPIDEINIDFEVQGPSAKNPSMLDVLIVASRTENVSNRVEAIKKAGLNPKVVDVESFAIERSVKVLSADLPAEGKDKIVAVIDIGRKFMHLFVLDGLKIIFSREEEFGGAQLTEAISIHYEIEPEEACNMLSDETKPDDFEQEVLMPFVETLIVQIKRTLQFFYSTSHHNYVDCILLAGGISRLPDIDKKVEERLLIQTKVSNPFRHLSLDKNVDQKRINKDAPSLMIACGLALRHVEKAR